MVFIVILAILVFFVVPRIRIKRAVNQVIAIFERNNALNPSSAKTIDELGLQPRSFLEQMGRIRDFKPYALQALINAGVIKQTEDAKLYLSQDRLAGTNISRH